MSKESLILLNKQDLIVEKDLDGGIVGVYEVSVASPRGVILEGIENTKGISIILTAAVDKTSDPDTVVITATRQNSRSNAKSILSHISDEDRRKLNLP